MEFLTLLVLAQSRSTGLNLVLHFGGWLCCLAIIAVIAWGATEAKKDGKKVFLVGAGVGLLFPVLGVIAAIVGAVAFPAREQDSGPRKSAVPLLLSIALGIAAAIGGSLFYIKTML